MWFTKSVANSIGCAEHTSDESYFVVSNILRIKSFKKDINQNNVNYSSFLVM